MILTYQELQQVPVQDNGSPLLPLKNTGIMYGYHPNKQDLATASGGEMWVRAEIFPRLQQAQSYLREQGSSYLLYILEGYRPLAIQQERFQQRLQILAGEQFYPNPIDLYEATHRTVAVPTVAGHPTGGAVDVTLYDPKPDALVDMGSAVYDYQNPLYSACADGLAADAKEHRQLLREAMYTAGFAPYDGEFWHFSYGDQEWAAYYGHPYACYTQLDPPWQRP